jgi:hypothetical protein
MKLAVDLKLEVEVPEEIYDCDAAMKDFVWRQYKDEMLAAMRFTGAVASEPRPCGGHDTCKWRRYVSRLVHTLSHR